MVVQQEVKPEVVPVAVKRQRQKKKKTVEYEDQVWYISGGGEGGLLLIHMYFIYLNAVNAKYSLLALDASQLPVCTIVPTNVTLLLCSGDHHGGVC